MIDPAKLRALDEELRFLADARQQMGYDRAGSAMQDAADAILAMAEREKRMREALEWYEAAVSAFPLNTAHGDKAYDELEADAGQTARAALAATSPPR